MLFHPPPNLPGVTFPDLEEPSPQDIPWIPFTQGRDEECCIRCFSIKSPRPKPDDEQSRTMGLGSEAGSTIPSIQSMRINRTPPSQLETNHCGRPTQSQKDRLFKSTLIPLDSVRRMHGESIGKITGTTTIILHRRPRTRTNYTIRIQTGMFNDRCSHLIYARHHSELR